MGRRSRLIRTGRDSPPRHRYKTPMINASATFYFTGYPAPWAAGGMRTD